MTYFFVFLPMSQKKGETPQMPSRRQPWFNLALYIHPVNNHSPSGTISVRSQVYLLSFFIENLFS